MRSVRISTSKFLWCCVIILTIIATNFNICLSALHNILLQWLALDYCALSFMLHFYLEVVYCTCTINRQGHPYIRCTSLAGQNHSRLKYFVEILNWETWRVLCWKRATLKPSPHQNTLTSQSTDHGAGSWAAPQTSSCLPPWCAWRTWSIRAGGPKESIDQIDISDHNAVQKYIRFYDMVS